MGRNRISDLLSEILDSVEEIWESSEILNTDEDFRNTSEFLNSLRILSKAKRNFSYVQGFE